MRHIVFVFIVLLTTMGTVFSEPQEPAKQAKGMKLDEKLTNALDMEFAKIPAGDFQMGITENDAARLIQRRLVDWPLGDWEKQVHKVKLTNGYYIGKHEVTVGQFRKFVDATQYETNAEDGFNAPRVTTIEGAITAGTWRDPQFMQGDDHPVVCVTSVDAQKFIDWLNKTDKKKPEGWEYRLPTEAEWEYAARGSKGTRYPWGNEWAEECARPAPEGHCFNLFKPDFLKFRTMPVGSFSPEGDSPFGVSDMSGNVSEWCLDWYEDNSPKRDQTDPLGPIPGTISRNGIYASPYTKDEESDLRIQQTMSSKVFKGDSWYDEKRFMSIAQRRYHLYGQRSYIGFRVALAPIVADRKRPAARAVPLQPGVNMVAATKSSREQLAAFKADAPVTEELYKEIVAADQMGILVSLDKKPERAIAKYYALMEDLSHRMGRLNRSDAEQRPPTVGELGLLLLAGSDPRMPKSDAYEKGYSTIKDCTEIVLDEVKPRRLLLRQLIKSWMLVWVPGKKGFNTIAQFYGMKEVASELAAMAVAPDTKPELRFNCLYSLINLASQKELETLSRLLKNKDKVPEELFRRSPGPFVVRMPRQWRDLALLVMIRIAGDEPTDYGFSNRTADARPSRYDLDFGFFPENDRNRAVEKWEACTKKFKQAEPNKDLNGPLTLEGTKDVSPLPQLSGKAPVFAIVTKVDTATETFNFFLLFDEIVNTEMTVEDEKGVVKKRTTNRVMTSRNEEKTGRPLKGSIVSTGDEKIIPMKQATAKLPGKMVLFCEDFDGLHPTYRKMLAKDTWIIEMEKPKGLRGESPLERLESVKVEKGVASDRDTVLAELKAKQVNTLGLTHSPKIGLAGINLGLGLDGGETANATDETLSLVTQLPDVEALQLWKGKLSPEALAKLANLPKLKSLDIWQSEIDTKAFAVLGKLKSLEFLRIQEYPVTDELLGYLGETTAIKALHIGKTKGVTTGGFAKFLKAAKNLESLFVGGDFLDDECLKLIGNKAGMKTLVVDSKTITSEGWKSLAGLTKLKRLDAPGTRFDDAGMKALEGLNGLNFLYLNDTRITDDGMSSLAGLTRLHDLYLEGSKITDKGMVHVKWLTELENLYVGRTDVTARGLAFVPDKNKMVMMGSGRGSLSPKQLDELMTIYPKTQMFDPVGYWTPERVKAAMKELGKDMPTQKKHTADLGGGMKMELVLIPAGKFKMGSGESAKDTAAFFNKTYRENFPPDGGGGLEEDFFKNEHPQHAVSITKPLFMGMHPITRGQFKQFVADTAYKTDTEKDKKLLAWGWDSEKKQFSNDKKYSWKNTGFKQTDEHPVVNVTWNDALAFCKWLSKKEGKNYRLPTEAEWEYTYRAGTTTRYPTGDDPKSLSKVGKLADLTDVTVRAKIPDWKYMIRATDNYVFTSPVGKSRPNAFGLYDMDGNAFQWCADWYGDKYYAASPADDPSGPDSGTDRVIRGGTWNFRPLGARSAERNKTEPDSRNCSAGFRVVRTQ